MKILNLRNVPIAVAFLTLAAIAIWQYLRIRHLTAHGALLREQLVQTGALREENAGLNDRLRTANERSVADFKELLQLRSQAGRTRQIEQENARLKSERDQLAKRAQSSSLGATDVNGQADEASQTPEQKFQRAKGFFGRDLGMALIRAAEANGGMVPSDLRGPLFDTVESLSARGEYDMRAKHFELVYQGSLRNVKDVGQIILAREREPVQRPDGQWMRLYVLADGSSQWVAADTRDGFAAREQQFWPGHFKPQ